jgi:ribonuclease P protein component
VTASTSGRAPRPPRLKKRGDFLRVARAGRKFAVPGLVLQASPTPPGAEAGTSTNPGLAKTGLASTARIGYTVSRKVGNAVCRNRARRRLKAAAERVMPVHAAAGTDFVIIGRVATLTRPFDALVGDLETALRKLKCYRD